MSKLDLSNILKLFKGLDEGVEIAEAAAKHFVTEFADDLARVSDNPKASLDDLFERIKNDEVMDAASKAVLSSKEFRHGFENLVALNRYYDDFRALGQAASLEDIANLSQKYGLSETDKAVRSTTRLVNRRAAIEASSAAPSSKAAASTAGASDDAAKVGKKGYFGSAATRGERLAVGSLLVATPVAFMIIERETGGAITHAIFSTSADAIIGAYKDIPVSQRKEWLADKIDKATFISDLVAFSPFKTAGLNAAVDLSLRNGTIEDAKNTAIKYVLVTSPMSIGMKTALRMQILDEVEKSMSMEERNKLIAEGLIEDVIKASHSSALGDDQITAQDIVTALKEKDGRIVQGIPSRVQNGLVQLYPELTEIFPDRASFKREKPSESVTELASERVDSASRTLHTAGDNAPNLNQLKGQFEGVAKVGFFGSLVKMAEKWFKGILTTVVGWFSITDSFNMASKVKDPKHNPEIVPGKLTNLVGGRPEEMTRKEFERNGGPTEADADRVMGRNQPAEEPSVDIS